MTESEENIFGLDFSRGHKINYKIAGRDTVWKKGGAKKTSSPFSEGKKRKAGGKTAGRNIVSAKKRGSEKNLLPIFGKRKMRNTRKRAGRDIVSKKGGAKKTSSPIYEGGK